MMKKMKRKWPGPAMIWIGFSLLGSGFLAGAGERSDVPVADAAIRRDLITVRSLLQQGVDVNSAQGDGMTALHWAARNNDVEMAEMLLYAGANLKATTRLGAYTPLLIAARNGSSDMIRKLLEAGADANARTSSGATPLMLAAAAGDTPGVASLLDHGAELNATESAMGQTALMFAAAADRSEVVRLLLSRNADAGLQSAVVDVAARAKRDDALHKERDKALNEAKKKMAAETDPEKPAVGEGKEGLEGSSGADEDRPAAGSRKGNRDQPNKARPETGLAAEQADAPSTSGKAGEPAKKPGFLARLFGRGKSDRKKAPATPPRQRSLSLADLVGHRGGYSALHLAAREGHLETVKALLAGGEDINQLSGGDRTSPLLIATINGHFDLALYLLANGADPRLASDAGCGPLYAAVNVEWAPHAFYPQPSTRQEKTTHLELLQALLSHGADPNLRLEKKVWFTGYNFDQSGVDEVGATAFWRAAQASDVEAMRILVEGGADPTIPTKIGPERRLPNGRNSDSELKEEGEDLGAPAVSPLQAATGAGFDGNYHRNSPAGWMPAVRYLVEELGADVNAADNKGYTPLHNAAARGDNEMIRYLVSRGADVMAVSKSGQTTADMANGPVQRIQPFPETLALLMELGAKNSGKCVSC